MDAIETVDTTHNKLNLTNQDIIADDMEDTDLYSYASMLDSQKDDSYDYSNIGQAFGMKHKLISIYLFFFFFFLFFF